MQADKLIAWKPRLAEKLPRWREDANHQHLSRKKCKNDWIFHKGLKQGLQIWNFSGWKRTPG